MARAWLKQSAFGCNKREENVWRGIEIYKSHYVRNEQDVTGNQGKVEGVAEEMSAHYCGPGVGGF